MGRLETANAKLVRMLALLVEENFSQSTHPTTNPPEKRKGIKNTSTYRGLWYVTRRWSLDVSLLGRAETTKEQSRNKTGIHEIGVKGACGLYAFQSVSSTLRWLDALE